MCIRILGKEGVQMKVMRKLAGLSMVMCLMVLLVPTVAYAASGRISFTDLTTEAGVEFDIKVQVTSEGDDLGSIEIELNYDNEVIQFVSGDDVTNNGSTLTYATDGSGTSTETVITFLALKQEDTTITIADQTVLTSGGSTIDVTEGNSSIEISGGTEVEATTSSSSGTSTEVVVAGVTYNISSEFAESETPEGYSATTYEYEGSTYNGVIGDTSGIVLGCLMSSEEEGQFFRYNTETLAFEPYVQITISEAASTYIMLLTTDIEETLPEEYVETVLTVNGFEFPTWEETSSTGFYLIHAINSNGEDSIYRYDTQDQTYQRYYPEEVVVEEEEIVEEENPLDALMDYAQWILIGVAILVILCLLLVLVLAVKLRNRNLELDDLYDEIEFGKTPNSNAVKVEAEPYGKATPKKKAKAKSSENQRPVDRNANSITKASETNKQKATDLSYDEFDDEFNDEFDDEFNDEFDNAFGYDVELAEAYERDTKDEYDDGFGNELDTLMNEKPRQAIRREDSESRNSLKKASQKRRKTLEEEIDFIDL